tara:strand:+ start:4278 stop:6299 length:2022 start_codon:yes stop_codon:yes gene_type:complete
MQSKKSSSATGSQTSSNVHLGFRPDIQGMRALAILLVVGSHAGIPGFAGGYIGVDIFFVLSGYLISGLLIKEADSNHRIDFLQFYARRFKRLLPALLTVVLGTSLLAYYIYAPFEQSSQSQAAFTVPLWLSNVYFSFSDFDYFSTQSTGNLFLHTWSLAVEEQFYLIWPLLIFAFLLQKNSTLNEVVNRQHNLSIGLAFIFFVSLLICIYWSYMAPLLAFYLMPARAWQFALGGIIFLLADGKIALPKNIQTAKHYTIMSYLGISMIAVTMLYLDGEQVYPGLNALLPTTGAALLLYSGLAPVSTLVNRVLSVSCLQKIGDLSYSWYLWHWPILLFGASLFPDSGLTMKISLLAVSLILAQCTYILIESPLRHYRQFTLRPVMTVFLALFFMGTAVAAIKGWEIKSTNIAAQAEQSRFLQARSQLPAIYAMGCDDWFSDARILACTFGDDNAERKAVLIGDSIGVQWFSGLAEPLVNAGWQFIVLTKSSCPIVDEEIFYARIGSIYEVCSIWRDEALKRISDIQPELVFIGSQSGYNFSAEQWQNGTSRILSALTPVSKSVFIIRGTEKLPLDGPACLARQNWQPDLFSRFNDCVFEHEENTDDIMLSAISTAAADFKNAYILDLNSLVCPQHKCRAELNGLVVFRDDQHLTNSFVRSQSEAIMTKVKIFHEL